VKDGDKVLPTRIDNIVKNPHVAADHLPDEDYKKTIYSEKPDRTYVKGTITKSPSGGYTLAGTFKTSSGEFKDYNSLTPDELKEIIDEFERERTKLEREYRNVPPSQGLQGCDEDADRDGVPNSTDNCPSYGESNPTQTDRDCDGVGDGCDNCPGTFNPDQADSDHDGIGNVCEGGGTSTSQYSESPNLAIPDNNLVGVSRTIQVPTNGVIADLDVQLQIDHPRQSDIVVELAHDGTVVKLIYRAGTSQPLAGCGPAAVGYSAANFGSTGTPLVLDDCAPVVVDCYDREGSGIPGYTGPVHPNRLLEAFAGLDKQGSWTLTVFDEAPGNAGFLRSWSLLFRELPPFVSTPSQVPALRPLGMVVFVVLLAVSGSLLLRRRKEQAAG